MNDQKIEIQIRTLSQHTWAAASHALQYKRQDAIPKPLKRSMNRIAALLELADVELERLLVEQAEYIKKIEISESNELNTETLKLLMERMYPEANKDARENYDDLVDELNGEGLNNIDKVKEFISTTLAWSMAQDQRQLDYAKGKREIGEDMGAVSDEDIARGAFYAQTGLLRIALTQHISDKKIARSKAAPKPEKMAKLRKAPSKIEKEQ